MTNTQKKNSTTTTSKNYSTISPSDSTSKNYLTIILTYMFIIKNVDPRLPYTHIETSGVESIIVDITKQIETQHAQEFAIISSCTCIQTKPNQTKKTNVERQLLIVKNNPTTYPKQP